MKKYNDNGWLRSTYHKLIQEFKIFDYGLNKIVCLNCDIKMYTDVVNDIKHIQHVKKECFSTKQLEKTFYLKYGFEYKNTIMIGARYKISDNDIKNKINKISNNDAELYENGFGLLLLMKLPYIILIKRPNEDFSQEE